jgi:hypothetical protein
MKSYFVQKQTIKITDAEGANKTMKAGRAKRTVQNGA